jgi:succinate dehydrogenase/fumarate reductase flavoprotein subunit
MAKLARAGPLDIGADGRLSRREFLVGTGLGVAAAARPLSKVKRWDGEADVLVVGLGAAGASAAIEAARAGASVLLLERAPVGGGTSALAGGILYFGGGTPLQKALGYEDSPEEMFKYLMATSGPGPDEAKIRSFCERSVEHYHWLVDKGVPFKASFYKGLGLPLTDDGLLYSGSEKAHPFNTLAKPAPRGHKVKVVGEAGGGLLMEKLTAAVLASEARLRTQMLCESLIRASDGNVVGVVARTGGEEKRFRARGGVVLAAGGFCHNKEMVARYAPLYLACDTPIGTAGDDGRGIRMGMAAGGDAIRMDSGFTALPLYPPEKLIEGILINAQGQRFINEDCYYGRTGEAILRHQQGNAILILDRECTLESRYGRLRLLCEAETIADLERKLGLPVPVLQNTLRLYNTHAARGQDPLFHKSAEFLRPLEKLPLRALDCSTRSAYYPFFTLGGLRTRTGGEVLNPAGDAVEGLYAAGRTTSGVSALGYSSGVSLADASLFGRLAGASAAARARSV